MSEAVSELKTAERQSEILQRLADEARFAIEPGPSMARGVA